MASRRPAASPEARRSRTARALGVGAVRVVRREREDEAPARLLDQDPSTGERAPALGAARDGAADPVHARAAAAALERHGLPAGRRGSADRDEPPPDEDLAEGRRLLAARAGRLLLGETCGDRLVGDAILGEGARDDHRGLVAGGEPWLAALEQRGEVVRERRRRLVARLGPLREELRHDPSDGVRDVGVRAVRGGRRLAHLLLEEPEGTLRREGRPPRDQEEERRPERVEVAAGVRHPARALLGAHEGRGAEDLPRHREGAGPARIGREPEVGDLHDAVPREEEVPGLHVAVDDAVAVRRVEAESRLADDPRREPPRERTVRLDPAVEALPRDQLHGEEEGAPLVPGLEDPDHVRMREPAGHAPLAEEPRDGPGRRRDPGPQDLHGHVARARDRFRAAGARGTPRGPVDLPRAPRPEEVREPPGPQPEPVQYSAPLRPRRRRTERRGLGRGDREGPRARRSHRGRRRVGHGSPPVGGTGGS